MKKILLSFAFLLFIPLSACGTIKKDSLDGEWISNYNDKTATLTISKDKFVYSDSGANFTGDVDREKKELISEAGDTSSYKIIGDKIAITRDSDGVTMSMERKD
jgi:hypothetical protein